MTPQTFQRVRDLFAAARDVPEDHVEQWLADACGHDQRLRDELHSLLARHREDGEEASGKSSHPLDRPVDMPVGLASTSHELGADVWAPAVPREQPGQLVGDYKLIRLIGEGGMGVVYEAEQQHPRRPVALKLIRPFLVSRNLLRRFEHESDVLARLDHPGIARVYEAGTFESPAGAGAQPFFAMELVRGVPLSAYARDRKLDTRARLQLLAKVCDAVHHAHQKGVVHRDLKPSNILVDESGQPKVLDFGVAKAVDGDVGTIAPSQTMHTESGQLVGTIPYMSPEQVAGDVRQIDTRSDVYALGVIGFELLAGRLPYAVLDKPLPEAARVIREDEPSRLSSVDRTFRGDVETIVGKALQKEKERRYGSAGELAADIARHLNYEPISARAPGTWYQFSRFARRNKTLVVGTAAVFLALLVGIVATSRQAVRARRAERTVRQEQLRTLEQKQQAERAAAVANQVKEFVQGVLELAKPEEAQGRQMTLAQALDVAAQRVEIVQDDPLIEAAVRESLGSTYESLGREDLALPHHERALALRRSALGDEHADTVQSINNLGNTLLGLGRHEAAGPLLEEAVERGRRVYGEAHPRTLMATGNLASVVSDAGRHVEAEALYRRTYDAARKELGPADLATLGLANNLAHALGMLGRWDDAHAIIREASDQCSRTLGDSHPATAHVAHTLAVVLERLNRIDEALAVYRANLPRMRRVLGEEHPHTRAAEAAFARLLQSATAPIDR
jgi:serine/threonine protein kinase